MAQTVKQLEKERAELLKAIGSQAQQNSSVDNSGHSLSDWLNAAEDVMPSNQSPKRRGKPRNAPKTIKITKQSTTKTKSSSIFTIIIVISLLLTIIGIIYISYISTNNEIRQVKQTQETSSSDIEELKSTVVEIEPKIKDLEKGIKQLKNNSPIAATGINNEELMNSKPVTTSLKGVEKQIHQLDYKLEQILLALVNRNPTITKTPVNLKKSTVKVKITEPTIIEPIAPKIKPIKQPVVRLLKRISTPKKVTAPKAPIADYTLDIKWLMDQPAFNYTLQLANMSGKAAAQKFINNKSLSGSHVVGVQKAGKTNYIILTGSYPTKKAANQARREYKANFGISAWVRKIKDISSKVK